MAAAHARLGWVVRGDASLPTCSSYGASPVPSMAWQRLIRNGTHQGRPHNRHRQAVLPPVAAHQLFRQVLAQCVVVWEGPTQPQRTGTHIGSITGQQQHVLAARRKQSGGVRGRHFNPSLDIAGCPWWQSWWDLTSQKPIKCGELTPLQQQWLRLLPGKHAAASAQRLVSREGLKHAHTSPAPVLRSQPPWCQS